MICHGLRGQNKPIKLHNQYFGRLIVWVAEGSEQLLTVIINLWYGIYAFANAPTSLYNGFLQMA